MAERRAAKDWLRELARASTGPAPVEFSGSELRIKGRPAQEMRVRRDDVPAPKAGAKITGIAGKPGNTLSRLAIHELAFIELALTTLGNQGPQAMSPEQKASLFMTAKGSEIALACGINKPAPSDAAGMSEKVQAEAKSYWTMRKAGKLPAPAPSMEPESEMEKLEKSLEKRLGKAPVEKLTLVQMQKLDYALAKMDAEGPEALEPKESASLFLTKASAAMAVDHGFQKPLDNEWNELRAEVPMNAEQRVALRRASQFDQASGVELAKGADLSESDNASEREAKAGMFQSAAMQLTGKSPVAGLAAVAVKLRDERDAEREIKLAKENGQAAVSKAPSPFALG